MFTATENMPVVTSKRRSSWAKMRAWLDVPPRPPYCFGQVMPAQPPS